MTRDQMINELKLLDLHAIPTVATMDMGLQYDYATAEGAGTGFGGMGNWPAHKFNCVSGEQWSVIRKGIKNKNLILEQLKGSGLDAFVREIQTLDEEIVLSEVFEDILNLPEKPIGDYYCLFDTGVWYAKGDNPSFFSSEESLKEAFVDRYVDDLTYWEDMDEDELTSWYERIQDEMAEFPLYTYDPE